MICGATEVEALAQAVLGLGPAACVVAVGTGTRASDASPALDAECTGGLLAATGTVSCVAANTYEVRAVLGPADATTVIAEAALRLSDGTGIARWKLATPVEVAAGESLPVAPRVTVTGTCDKDYLARLMVGAGGTPRPMLALGSGTRVTDSNPVLQTPHDNDHGLGPVDVTPAYVSDGVYDLIHIFTARDNAAALTYAEMAIVGIYRGKAGTAIPLLNGESLRMPPRMTFAVVTP